MTAPQFVNPGQSQMPQNRVDARMVAVAIFAPVVFAITYFFWLALDNPPLPVIPLVLCIASFVIGVAALASIFRAQGISGAAAVVIAIVALPMMLIAASFVVIALAFSLGSIF